VYSINRVPSPGILSRVIVIGLIVGIVGYIWLTYATVTLVGWFMPTYGPQQAPSIQLQGSTTLQGSSYQLQPAASVH